MANYRSDRVSVFPSTYRVVHPEGKFTNETNFANIIKSIVDKQNYVVSYKSNILRLVIGGYYFRIEGVTILPKWAAIIVEQDLVGRGYNLVNYFDQSTTLDDEDYFKGIELGDGDMPTSGAISGGYYRYSMPLMINGKLNSARFSSNSIYWNNNTDRTLTDEVNSKQGTLKAGPGIEFYTDTSDDTEYVKIVDKYRTSLDSLNGGSITDPQLIYFNNQGILGDVDVSVGKGFTSNSSGKGTVQLVHLNHGRIKGNITINYSTNAPGTAAGQNGDIWIKFSN